MLNRTMAPLVLAVLLPVALAAPKEVSRPRDPEEGGGLRRGLGLQVGSFVWTAGVSPRPPAAELARRKGPGPEASPAAWQQTAEGDEQEEAGGEVVTIQLSPAVGEGPALGLGPQLGAKVSPEGQAEAGAASGGAQEAEDAGEAAVSMPMSEQDPAPAVGPALAERRRAYTSVVGGRPRMVRLRARVGQPVQRPLFPAVPPRQRVPAGDCLLLQPDQEAQQAGEVRQASRRRLGGGKGVPLPPGLR
ncbi:unnamed protein product [Prorocentrum cordatum]|uniref:Uncharacterized protein n=1 Tax=Prorocentrum cordatum TaxID=2364126 RepID=A0ABN9UUW1_9DINO|nr:unnamed protein product [Polarella glacialis]